MKQKVYYFQYLKKMKQTHTKPQKTLEFKFTKSRETFSFIY